MAETEREVADEVALLAYIRWLHDRGAPQWVAEVAAQEYAKSDWYAGWQAHAAVSAAREGRLSAHLQRIADLTADDGPLRLRLKDRTSIRRVLAGEEATGG